MKTSIRVHSPFPISPGGIPLVRRKHCLFFERFSQDYKITVHRPPGTGSFFGRFRTFAE